MRNSVATSVPRHAHDIRVELETILDRINWVRLHIGAEPFGAWGDDVRYDFDRYEEFSRLHQRYSCEELHSSCDSEWDEGYMYGKMAALRWVLGADWDSHGLS